MRLNSFIARAGISSRRRADALIKSGRITVNGKAGQLNSEVSETDGVKLDGKLLIQQTNRYILLHKPAGYVTTLKDEKGRRKVFDLINISVRVVPVGRLDYDTTGVLILTNDGDLANRLMHPSYKVDKTYEVTIEGKITDDKLQKLETGITLDDGRAAPAKAYKVSENKIELIIHEGRKHQVKRMMAAIDMRVIKLHRSKYAGIELGTLKPGQWRDLTPDEVSALKLYTLKSEKTG